MTGVSWRFVFIVTKLSAIRQIVVGTNQKIKEIITFNIIKNYARCISFRLTFFSIRGKIQKKNAVVKNFKWCLKILVEEFKINFMILKKDKICYSMKETTMYVCECV